MLFDGSHFFCSGEETGTYKFKIGFKDNGKITAFQANTLWCRSGQGDKLQHGSSIENIHCTHTDPYLSKGAIVCFKDGGKSTIFVQYAYNRVAAEHGHGPDQSPK
jgi:hypothetical protein